MYVVGFAETVIELLKVNVAVLCILLSWGLFLLLFSICLNYDTF